MKEQEMKQEEPVMPEIAEERKALSAKQKPEEISETASLLCDNKGVGVVEVILILVVLIALVLIFKDQLGGLVTRAMEALEESIDEVLS